MREQADRLAQIYVDLFLDDRLDAVRGGRAAAAGWPDVQDALERLHPLASESLLAVFGMAMKDAVERESARAMKRMAGDPAQSVAS